MFYYPSYKIPSFVILSQLGPEIRVIVKKSKKAKRYIIKIIKYRVELILPNNNLKEGYNFLIKKEAWVRKKLAIKETLESIDYSIVPIWGLNHQINYIESRYSHLELNLGEVIIYSPTKLKGYHYLINFLKKIFIEKIESLVENLKEDHKFNYNKIRITNTKTNWGSCNSKGTLAFNWRLIFTPEEVLYYVVVHEICHLNEMNHSKSFWNLVENLCPDYKQVRSWLKQNGMALRKYLLLPIN